MKSGTLRIISGRWRGRRITFPAVEGLRPTHDRIRETLFNWLEPMIKGASCLDLFAGSGALGFEALSRGAKQVTFVDHHRKAIAAIKTNALALEADVVESIWGDCPKKMPALQLAPYDIVFLDPPFHEGLLVSASTWLEQSNYLNRGAHIYIEVEKGAGELPIPTHWSVIKSGKTAQIEYYLLICE